MTMLFTRLKGRSVASLVASFAGRARLPRLRCARAVTSLMAGRSGLELGGPTPLFARDGPLPVYTAIGRLDNCNFSRQTVWEGAIEEGRTFQYDSRREPGRQFIGEASNLAGIAGEQYDVVLSSHTLEHCANPLRVLREWLRVLKEEGLLLLVLPHKDGTFDHRRPVTTLAHLVDDDRAGTGEGDLTHLPEILALHDLALDPRAGDLAAFTERSLRNAENRCLHHHVFDTRLAVELVDAMALQILHVEAVQPHDIFVVARKTGRDRRIDNRRFLGPGAAACALSPFASDRA